MKLEITLIDHRPKANEVPPWAALLNLKLDFITQRLTHMATDAQVAQLRTDIGIMIDAYTAAITAAVAKAQAQSPDPAIDALDQTVKDATAKIVAAAAAPAVAVPVTPPAA